MEFLRALKGVGVVTVREIEAVAILGFLPSSLGGRPCHNYNPCPYRSYSYNKKKYK